MTVLAPRRRTFDGAAGTLVADVWGRDGAPPVVLLHGGGQTRGSWGGVGARLAALGRQAIAVDQRGHGESAWSPDGRYDFDCLADDVRAVCAALYTAPPVLVGASMGGICATLAAGEEPRVAVERLILVDVAHRPESEGVKRIVEFMRARPEGFAGLAEAHAAVAEYLRHRETPEDARGLERNLRRRGDRWVWHWDPRLLDAFAAADTHDTRRRIVTAARSITPAPVLVRGGASDVVSPEIAAEFRALVPGAVWIDVDDAGHMVAGDRNDRFLAAIERLL